MSFHVHAVHALQQSITGAVRFPGTGAHPHGSSISQQAFERLGSWVMGTLRPSRFTLHVTWPLRFLPNARLGSTLTESLMPQIRGRHNVTRTHMRCICNVI
jgi:hypothetical protein